MSDPRITPDPALMQRQERMQVDVPLTDLCRKPDGPRDRQLVYGDAITLLGTSKDWSYLQATRDGYCGWVRTSSLGPHQRPTHLVSAPATHAYSAADLKSPERVSLSFGSRVVVRTQNNSFAETSLGYIPSQHLQPADAPETDPATVAKLFIGTPYLWGGNSRWGIDCSGLIQAALLACHIPCPGDSDLQMALGKEATPPYQRNDLLFWKGHVALITDSENLIHATAHSMSCLIEPIQRVIARIEKSEGPLLAHRRL
ncbi:MAG: C40 family peptidase [Sulfitobacter sp.]|nr:C40 family peptidase [Sulfitobacter sp.]